MRWLALLLLSCGACINGSDMQALPNDQLEPFAELAQPVLETRCANPSCHGNGERPLAVFAVHRYRMDESSTFVDAPLTEEELRLNLLRAALFTVDLEHASDSMLLVKPRSRHADVDVFTDDADFDYRRLHGWIETAMHDRAAAP